MKLRVVELYAVSGSDPSDYTVEDAPDGWRVHTVLEAVVHYPHLGLRVVLDEVAR